VVALSTVPNGWPPPVHVAVAVAAAVAMGATVGVITGTTLVRLTTPSESTGAVLGFSGTSKEARR
jgi:ribose/xylose/arabinose/galactoside ABC-type transport system permease subunit